ncbi:MAG: hypothetical protein IJW96_03060 [Clostridia bacterium]|nr:hypothetical protein [Clostridia bacterium]
MRKLSGYEIALSALSAAFATLFLVIGVYTDIFLFTGYLFACIALMLPLAKKSYWGFGLAYGASCLLSLIFGASRFIDLLPFILFFGLHPLVNELQLKTKINRWVACGVKALWFDGAMYLIWRFVFEMTTTISFVDQYIIPIILVFGTAFFVLYDYIMYKWRFIINRLVERLITRKK